MTDQANGNASGPHISVEDLTIAYGDFVIMHDLNFTVQHGDVFVIMGASGSGKSTLLRNMIGLNEPTKGDVKYDGQSFTHAAASTRQKMLQRFGVMYQGGALFSSMTLAENVGLPLGEYTTLSEAEIREVASLKLALVGLKGFEDFFPAEISGGMWKRAGIARAMALDPDILFFDDPSAGLDPISSRQLDDLLLELRASLRATIVVVTHELPSIFAIATNSVFLDIETKTIIAQGPPKAMLESDDTDPKVRRFLTRGEDDAKPEENAKAEEGNTHG
jgi:phospholipid/cholesterol/gamma-HCH transport system ATP-binding protein